MKYTGAAALLLATASCSAFVPSSNNIQPRHLTTTSRTTSTTPHYYQQTTTQLNLFSNFNFQKSQPKEPAAEPGIGEAGCALPSPSGVNMLPESQQTAIFVAIYAGLGLGTYLLSSLLSSATLQYEWIQSWKYTWPLLGVIYAAAGATHFTVEDEYVNIYPANKAWGFWSLPGSPQFHVRWTGVAELLGGLGLLIGGAFDAFAPVYTQFPNVLTPAGIGSDSAAALLLLTLVVTPANIYMYTHGAKLPMKTPDGEPGLEIPVAGHAIRGVLQVVLLALLYQMGEGTFYSIVNGSFGCPTC